MTLWVDVMQLNLIENKLKDLEKVKDSVENYAHEYQQLLKTKQELEVRLLQQHVSPSSAIFY